jgi:integrative and conjugative element protein (TIGR02256 family)
MLQWYKKHRQFLVKESTALTNDPNKNYKEIYQCRDNLFISHGNIIVRLSKIYKSPILVVYTDATPYRLPSIFPLKKELTKAQIDDIAKLPFSDAVSKLKEHVEYYYELRHQNSSGELCVLERENLDTGNTFYGITTILQRVRDWYAGHITHNYPPDSEEVDFCSHFNFINQDVKLFYPEHFLNTQFIEGDCYATLFSFQPAGKYFSHNRYLYMGGFLDGIGKSGLYEQVYINLERQFHHEKIKDSISLVANSEIVNSLIKEKELLKAQWFQINKEPRPFHLFKDLISIIGNGDYDAGIKRIVARCRETISQNPIPDSLLIAIRFLNRKEKNEFQLFKVFLANKEPQIIISSNPDEQLIARLGFYENVEAIEGEKLTEETYHQRNSKRADYDVLKEKFVNIFGVGAIGSEVADCLTKAGIGNVVLFDNQLMKAHNPVRHLGTLEQIGEPKVTAVSELLYKHNPFVHILPVPLNLFELDTSSEYFIDDSISISSVADDNVEGFINQQLVVANKPIFYVRALRGGKVVRIVRVIPGKDACFNCLTLHRADGNVFIEIPDDLEYPTLKNECNNPIRPASAADLKFAASIASRILIDHLQDKESEFNHWIWTSESIEDTELRNPYQFYRQYIPPHKDCYYCNHDKQVSVNVNQKAIDFMQGLIKENPKIETGGVLAGYIEANGDVIITNASEAGPKAIKLATKFEKDVEFCQNFLDKLYLESNKKVVYVGEWHSHPSVNNRPSGTDIKSLSEIAMQKEYLTDNPTMIIFSNNGNPSCTIHPAGKRYYFKELKII